MSDFREAWSLERALVRGRLSRRDFIRRSAALGLSAPTIAAVLAACGASPTPTSVPAAATTAPTALGATAAPTRAAGGASPAATTGAARGASPAATSAATTAAPAGGQPKPGGTTVWAAESDPVSLNPLTNSAFQSTQGFEHSYESLTGYDSKLNIVPALAERWETPDDTTYIFHLRQGVKWHDGTDFTAEDVKYTFDIVIDPKGPAGWRANFDAVSAIDIVDKYTVKFTTKTPFPPLLGAFAILRSSAIIQKGAMERKKLDTEVVGTGPYKLVEYVPKSHIRLVKHKDYWDKSLPYIDEVTFKILEDEDARIAGLRGGSLDYALLSPEGQQRLQNEKSIVITSNPRIYNYIISFNPRRKPWFDPKVRQAVNLAIDRQEISDKVFSGGLTPGGPIPPGFGNWPIPNEELTSKWYKQDVEQAKQLLKEAGVQQGQELDFVVTAFNQYFPSLAVVVADQLKKIGINVKIRQLETGVFIKETSAEGGFNFDMQPNAFTPRHDPDGFVYRFHSSQETALGYKNERLDDLLIKGRTTIDPAKRKEYYDEVQRILLTDLPLVWLGVDNVIEGVRTTVKGYTQSPFTRRDWGLKHAWLEK